MDEIANCCDMVDQMVTRVNVLEDRVEGLETQGVDLNKYQVAR